MSIGTAISDDYVTLLPERYGILTSMLFRGDVLRTVDELREEQE